MIADFHSPNAVLISYRGGAYGNFLYHVLSTHLSNTVKVDNDHFNFSSTGNSHYTKKYVAIYWLAGFLDKKIKSYSDYHYVPQVDDEIAWNQIQQGKKFLVLCDTGPVDNHQYLLSSWSKSRLIRAYMPDFVDRLVAYANLFHKALQPTEAYKNSLFDNETMRGFRQQGGDLDIIVEDALLRLFQQNFNLYGKTFVTAIDNPRIFNFAIGSMTSWTTFSQTVHDLARFLGDEVIAMDDLMALYHHFRDHQPNLKYYSFTPDTVPDKDDLIGRALVRFYQQQVMMSK